MNNHTQQNKRLPFKHYHLNGRRRFVIYLADLIDYIHQQCDTACRVVSYPDLKAILDTSKLRTGRDFGYHSERDDYALSIAAIHALLVLYIATSPNADEINACWTIYHQLTDFLLSRGQ